MIQRRRFLVDVDEVLADFQTPFFEAAYRLLGRKLRAEDCDVWDCFTLLAEAELRLVLDEIERPGWCAALSPKTGTQQAIGKIRSFMDVYAVTSHFPTSKTWVHERDEWLKKYFNFTGKDIVHTRAKYLVRGDAFLDDNPDHVTHWASEHPEMLAMLWDLPNTRTLPIIRRDFIRGPVYQPDMPDILKNTDLPGTKLLLVDDLAPEDLAMLQALYSRSAESAEIHLKKVELAGHGKFMDNYVVKYNHKSIADCGTTTFFIEGVSTLVAKAVQDWPLYSGQETSTRYIDMGKQRIVDPVGTQQSKEILDRWMEFYLASQGPVSETIRHRYPKKPGETDAAYDGAVKARTFDSLRGFLPSGVTTQLSWHTNLRQAGDHITLLSKHPSEEVRQISLALQKMFNERYPSSGGADKAAVSAITGNEDADKTREQARQARIAWDTMMVEKYNYSAEVGFALKDSFSTTINPASLLPYKEALSTRPRGCVLPHFFSDLGQCSYNFLLDFGSYRDIQRHRNGVCRMPLVTTRYGFEPWYLEQLGDAERVKANALLTTLSDAAMSVTKDDVARQYYLPMGFRVPCQVTYALPSAIYVMELRSGKTIHPTLRRTIQGMILDFHRVFPEIPLHVDMDLDDWSVRRGSQTITAK